MICHLRVAWMPSSQLHLLGRRGCRLVRLQRFPLTSRQSRRWRSPQIVYAWTTLQIFQTRNPLLSLSGRRSLLDCCIVPRHFGYSGWVKTEEDAVAAAINLQRDARLMLSNLQILSQFVTSLYQMSTEMLNRGMGHVVFPSHEVAALSPARAAQYMAAMGLWHPQTGPGDPEPVPASSCNACMNCQYCFPEGPLSSRK